MLTSLFISAGLAAPLNDSLDPWGRPTHARVIIEPPSELADLYAPERRCRFWWDDVGLTATIEIRGRLRWKTLATDVPLGWISDELPRDSIFRIRLKEAHVPRIHCLQTSSTAHRLARLADPMRCSPRSFWI